VTLARFILLSLLVTGLLFVDASSADDVTLQLQYQTETDTGTGRYHRLVRQETWKPEETAVIVCDMWDLHHSLNAVRRVEEFAPRLNELLGEARRLGMTIIHSPSDCMDAYAQHPARRRATAAPRSASLPDDIESWCSRIPEEERAVYPVDQSDGGADDDPAEHARWAAKLEKMGRNPGTPWKTQTDLISIDAERDYVSDRGDEVWNVLQQRGIQNVILTGVHTNMCVLGRPFGLRQMARNGKNVVLVRDMTDTMYNPARWPYVSTFTGTDLIASHIERFVCPTITSDQIIGGRPDCQPCVFVAQSSGSRRLRRVARVRRASVRRQLHESPRQPLAVDRGHRPRGKRASASVRLDERIVSARRFALQDRATRFWGNCVANRYGGRPPD
jgi:nicotinamidase-related amidase